MQFYECVASIEELWLSIIYLKPNKEAHSTLVEFMRNPKVLNAFDLHCMIVRMFELFQLG